MKPADEGCVLYSQSEAGAFHGVRVCVGRCRTPAIVPTMPGSVFCLMRIMSI